MTFPNPWGDHPPAEADRDRAVRMGCLHMAIMLATHDHSPDAGHEEPGPSGLMVFKPARDPEAILSAAKQFHAFIEEQPGVSPHRVALEEIGALFERPSVLTVDPGLRDQVQALVRGALGLGR